MSLLGMVGLLASNLAAGIPIGLPLGIPIGLAAGMKTGKQKLLGKLESAMNSGKLQVNDATGKPLHLEALMEILESQDDD